MKRNKLFIFVALIPCTIALSGCFLGNIINNNQEEIVVDLPKIEVVNNLKINLRGRTTKSLYPALSNNSVKNPTFTFSSNNEAVATVSSDGLVQGRTTGDAKITITLTNNTNVNTTVKVHVVDEEVKHYDYTIMFYMCGSDLEYNSETPENEQIHYFTQDIQEILSVHDIPSSVKIIIETGGTLRWAMPSADLEGASQISATNLQRWEVDNNTNKLKLVETLPTNYMASESSFSEFLSWGLDDYEADQMGVVMSGHGGGIAGCVFDDNYVVKVSNQLWQRTLRTFEVAGAAKAALSNSNRDKFTWIGYDCCVMQCADIATINADYFDYMIASQENELATGWNHDLYLPLLKANTHISPEVLLPEICDAFILDNHKEVENDDEICYQTQSVLDLSKTNTLVTAFNALVENLENSCYTVREPFDKAEIAFGNSLNRFGDKTFGLCDFSSFMDKLHEEVSSLDVSSVKEAINDMVIYKNNCSKYITSYGISPCGVNAFFPKTLHSKYILQVGREDYSNSLSTKFSKWQELCVTFAKNTSSKKCYFGWESI